MAQPLGIEPSSTDLQSAAMTTSAKVGFGTPGRTRTLNKTFVASRDIPFHYGDIGAGTQNRTAASTLATSQATITSCPLFTMYDVDVLH